MWSALNLLKRSLQKWSIPLQDHPDPRLHLSWNWVQLALIVLPFSPLLASFGIFFALLALWKTHARLMLARPFNQGLIALSILMLLSATFAARPGDAFLGLFNFLPFFLGFAVLSELIQSPAQLRRMAWIVVYTSVPVVLIGLLQMLAGSMGWQQPFHPQILWVLLEWNIDPKGTPPGRMSSIFFYANVLASYLVISFSLAMGLWMEAVGEGRRTKNQEAHKIPNPKSQIPNWLSCHSQVLFLTLAFVGNAIALILTNSRNAWVIAAIACLACGLYRGWYWLWMGVSAVAGMVLGASFAPSPLREGLRHIIPAFFWARLTDELYPDRPVPTLRTTQWQFALHLTQQRPWTGWGLRNFSPLYEAATQFKLGHPHNLPFMLLCETGIPATLLFLGLVGWAVVQGFRQLSSFGDGRDRWILLTFLIAFLSCAGFSLFDITLFDARLNWYGWFLLAGILGVSRPSMRMRDERWGIIHFLRDHD